MDNCCLAVAAAVISTEAGEQDNPDNPIAAVIVAAIMAAVAAKDTVTASVISVAEE